MTPQTLLNFWFAPQQEKRWFNSTPEFDQQIHEQFEQVWIMAKAGQQTDWEQTAEGALALVVLLDQMPLNMYRGLPESFSTEAQARTVAERAIEQGFDLQLTDSGKAFLYMPFMHSEDMRDQDRSVALYEAAGLKHNLKFAKHHRDIVRRFGRFPHRNMILGRTSTEEETDWLGSDEAFTG
ncbi:MAG: DUF924 domain-containing protein [Gammaproteobacteria bacterium]|nr:DUF924 domain-containing protein [Gammaproteobacteria bacterium]